MGFAIPTLAQLVARIKGDLNARMGNTNAFIPRTLAWCLSYAVAGVVWGLYLYQAYIARQVFPDTAEAENLLRWGALWIGAKVPASKSSGAVSVYAVAGSTLDTGAVQQRGDGIRYLTTAGPYTWLTSSSQDVTVEAEEAGADGEADAGTILTLVSPPAGVRSENAVTAAALTGGTDEESDESYLERIIDRIQNPPQGGSAADYEAWAQGALATVDRVWVQGWPDAALGVVLVFFTVRPAGTPGVPLGTAVIPSSVPGSHVAAVQAAIDPVRPVDAKAVTAVAPIGQAVTLALDLHREATNTDSAADWEQAIACELEEMFRERAELAGSGSTIPNSYLLEAVSQMVGMDYFELTSVDGGAGTDDITLGADAYPTIVAADVTVTLV